MPSKKQVVPGRTLTNYASELGKDDRSKLVKVSAVMGMSQQSYVHRAILRQLERDLETPNVLSAYLAMKQVETDKEKDEAE